MLQHDSFPSPFFSYRERRIRGGRKKLMTLSVVSSFIYINNLGDTFLAFYDPCVIFFFQNNCFLSLISLWSMTFHFQNHLNQSLKEQQKFTWHFLDTAQECHVMLECPFVTVKKLTIWELSSIEPISIRERVYKMGKINLFENINKKSKSLFETR